MGSSSKGYGATTKVSVEKSQAELGSLLRKHGATGLGVAFDEQRAMCAFVMQARHVRLSVPLPTLEEVKKLKGTPRTWWSMSVAERARWEKDARDQVERQRWRQLILLVKAKLEVIELGLSTVEREFLADLVLPGGSTMHEHVRAGIDELYVTGRLPPLLGGGTSP